VTALSIKHSAATIVFGHTLTLSGALTRSNGVGVVGATVRIYRQLDSGAIARIGLVTTGTAGAWHLTLKPTQNATYAAVFAGDAADTARTSATARTLVAPLVRIVSPKAGSTGPAGTAFVVTGTVSPNKAGKTARLYYLDASRHLHLLKSARLSSKSGFRFSVTLRHGTWRLVVLIGATTGNTAGRSTTTKVTRV